MRVIPSAFSICTKWMYNSWNDLVDTDGDLIIIIIFLIQHHLFIKLCSFIQFSALVI